MDQKVVQFWEAYRSTNPDAPERPNAVFPFCDNEKDADACADLVLIEQKRATACSLAELEVAGEPIPQPGDYSVVTRWSGEPVAVIRTTKVEIRKYADVDEAFAKREGEGDLTLAWWRKAHEAYYRRVLSGSKFSFSDDLEIACEEFELVFKA